MKTAPSERLSPSVSADHRTLDKSLAGGIAWTAGVKWSGQLLTWACTLVVARLLTPSDFGLVGMAVVYLGLVTAFSEFGLGTAVITLRELKHEQVAQINTVSLLFGAVGFAISCGVAIPLGGFFRAPQLPSVVVVMSAAFVITAFRTVPYSLLQKDMRFKLLAVMDGLQAAAQSLGVVAFAVLGLRYWSLVLGGLLGAIVSTAMPLAWRPHGFAWPRFGSIRHALTFSWRIIVTRLAWYGYSNADFLVAGRVLGEAALGAYTFAWNLASLPGEKVTALVTGVTPAFFSAVQTEQAALRRYLRTLTEGLALITFPATFGMALVAPEFVHLALGKRWEGVIVPLELLALYASLRSIVTLLPQVLTVVGETRLVMRVTIAALLVLPTVFYFGSRWGTVGIASGWILVYPLLIVPLYGRTFRKIDMSIREYLRAPWPAFEGSVIMAVSVGMLKWTLPSGLPLYLRFGLEVLGGGAAYILTLVAAHRERLRAFFQLVRTFRR